MALKEAMEKTLSFEMTWGSTTSSGYCSQDDSDSELEQFFTARTSFFIKVKRKKVRRPRQLKKPQRSLVYQVDNVLSPKTDLPLFSTDYVT